MAPMPNVAQMAHDITRDFTVEAHIVDIIALLFLNSR